ncbi:hypothetical protein BGX26_012017 [Mortierella sp. AD094]|nr:hypothetical protein BGX26_012017 [Mortierella sp. AD094]
MTAIMNSFETRPSIFDAEEDTSNDTLWLSTYSRALCSLYPKDEDVLLNLQPSTAFGKFAEAPPSFAAPSLQSNRDSAELSRHRSHQRRIYQRHSHSYSSRTNMPNAFKMEDTANNVASASSIPREATPFKDTEESTEDVVERLRSAPSSPGSKLSQMLCNIGFSWIDYFSPLDDEQAEEADAATQEGLGDYWAADVYGKRTAALERRRTLSRTSGLANGTSDSWIEALERLGHWDETA